MNGDLVLRGTGDPTMSRTRYRIAIRLACDVAGRPVPGTQSASKQERVDVECPWIGTC